MDYICGECGQPLNPTSKKKKKYKCECWVNTKSKDIPTMAEIIKFMSDRFEPKNVFH